MGMVRRRPRVRPMAPAGMMVVRGSAICGRRYRYRVYVKRRMAISERKIMPVVVRRTRARVVRRRVDLDVGRRPA